MSFYDDQNWHISGPRIDNASCRQFITARVRNVFSLFTTRGCRRGYPSLWSEVPCQPLVPFPFQASGPMSLVLSKISVSGQRSLPAFGHMSFLRWGGGTHCDRTRSTPQTGERVMLRTDRYASCDHAGLSRLKMETYLPHLPSLV